MPDESLARSALRALVVDDHPDAAETLARVLRIFGCDAISVTSSARAMQTLGDYQPDIVFLDLRMPPPDGYDIARLIRSNYPLRRFRLVALTAYGGEEDRTRTRQAGFDAHLLKPASPELVKATLHELFPALDGK